MREWKYCGFPTNVTRSLQFLWSSPLRGEAHPRGSRSDSDAPWWDTRGTGEPSLRSRTPKLLGSYKRIVREAGDSFHRIISKWERLLPVGGKAILSSTKPRLRGTLRIHQGIRGAPPRGRS